MRALADAVAAGRLPKLAVEKLDGEPVIGSGHEEALLDAGFARGPRKLTAGRRRARRMGDNRAMEDRRGVASPVELLRSVPLFADLEEDELERFSRVAVPRSFPAGDPRLPRGRPLRRLLHRPRGQLPGHPRALRRAGDHPRDARPGRHLRRAGDARRRGPLGQRRSAQRR